MSRKNKKRDRKYSGADAAASKPNITRVTAVVRSPLGEWWHENKKRVKLIAMIAGGIVIFGYLIYEFIRIIN
ncbi:MAG TPA: hypothetical protein VLA77_01905 [Candidatus Saccharimonadales bacterium]|nr:hypothetical protein [Candidatus Saccharimonadales bacterium]